MSPAQHTKRGAAGAKARARSETAFDSLREAVDALPDGFVLYDAKDRAVLWNGHFLDLYPDVAEVLSGGASFAEVEEACAAYYRSAAGRPVGDGYLEWRRELHRNPGEPFECAFRDGRWVRVDERRMPDGGTAVMHSDVTELKQREEALHERELHFAGDQRVAKLGHWAWVESNGERFYCSHQAERLFGVPYGTVYDSIDDILAPVHPDDRERVRSVIERAKEHCTAYRIEYKTVASNGEAHSVVEHAEPMLDGAGELLCTVGTIEDVSDRRQIEEELHESEERYRELFDESPVAIWDEDWSAVKQMIDRLAAAGVSNWREYFRRHRDRAIEAANLVVVKDMSRATLAIYRAASKEAVLKKMSDERMEADELDAFCRQLIAYAEGETDIVVESRELALDGSPVWTRLQAVIPPRHEGSWSRVLYGLIDISENKQAEKRLEYLAHHDALTGLPNRNLFEDRLEQEMVHARRSGSLIALHFMDLDHFKEINDTLGHPVGDDLLVAVSERLVGMVRASDTVARLGGDEFAIIQPELDSPDGAGTLARKATETLAEPFTLGENEVRTGATVGIALFPNDARERAQLLKNADIALYVGKTKGRQTFEFFDPSMSAELDERRSLEDELNGAVGRGEFLVYYQPRIDLQSGRVCGVEALVRWRHPTRGIVPPNEFIVVAEDSGLIRELGRWVMTSACENARAWNRPGTPPLSVSVNMSSAQFRRDDVEAIVKEALDASELEPTQLELEITEAMMIEKHRNDVIPTLTRLRDMGVQIAVDDFGTGYASLAYIRRFPVSNVKIDHAFVQGIADNPEDKAIVQSVITLGRSLGLRVTAEGVETEEQMTMLKAWDCDEAQGFYYSRPLPADELTPYLDEGR